MVDIEALRHHRATAQISNWAKDIRTGLARVVDERPIYPKNLHLDRTPPHPDEYRRAPREADRAAARP